MIQLRCVVGWTLILLGMTLLPLTAAAQERARDGGIFRWDGQGWAQVPGAAIRISVGPDGSPCVVNSRGDIYRWANGTFQQMPGKAKDIGVGADGSVWVIGSDDGVYKWNGQAWDRVLGAGVAISVGSSGAPWVVNAAGEIYRWVGDHFELQPGRALDIGAERSICVIGTDNEIYRWSRGSWAQVPGAATRISVAPDGSPWVVNAAGEIFRWAGGAFQKLPGAAMDIGVGAEGTAWVIGTAVGQPPRVERVPKEEPARPLGSMRGQGFKYPPKVLPDVEAVTFEFLTNQATVPVIEVSKRPPSPGPKFQQGEVVSAVFPVLAGKQTKHKLRVGNLRPGTHYFYIITIGDGAGQPVTETGEFTTRVRID